MVRLPTATLVAAATVTVTASNSGGSASASFKLSVAAAAPALVTAPGLSGTGKIGAAVSVDAGSWSGKPAPVTALQWRRDGATSPAPPGRATRRWRRTTGPQLSCRVTASNVAGSAVATTAALPVTRVAPVASGTLADLVLDQGAAAGSVAAAAAFTGAGLGYAVSGAGATIDAATGVVGLPTATLVAAATVTVTARTPAAALGELQAQRGGVAPALVTAPQLSGSGKIGAAVGVDAGSWSGKPTPVTALQWRRDGCGYRRRHRRELHPGGGGRPDRGSAAG